MHPFGTVMRERREALGIKQEELSAAVGYRTRSTIANIEKGTQLPSWDKALAIADYLRLPIEAFRKADIILIRDASTTMIEVKKVQRAVKQLRRVADELSAAMKSQPPSPPPAPA
jgi:transcriptional regulator with XRE-family HTH domain